MVWLFDAREAYERQRLTLRRKDSNDYVTFQWKQARRSILACKRTLLLDLGQGLVLSVKKYDGPPIRGWGQVFRTTDVWSWLRDGAKPTPIEWTGDQHEDLVNRIVQAAIYLRHHPPSSAPTSPGGETRRWLSATGVAGVLLLWRSRRGQGRGRGPAGVRAGRTLPTGSRSVCWPVWC
ncbi:hypothetical protein GCM10009789_39910 [Kribbella sancticallisti]|uniref:Uncharacterized protein n=1 Tax=Kribbella sancticallisti TaxID=460087 RepID=A0ABN2DS89_9ACTN